MAQRPSGGALAAAPVKVELSHVAVPRATVLNHPQQSLPISFGRPVAPDDDAAPAPARWRHKKRTPPRAHHTSLTSPTVPDENTGA